MGEEGSAEISPHMRWRASGAPPDLCGPPVKGKFPKGKERQIFMNLAQHFPKQTIVFVSHRIASLKWVDRIIVLNRGVIEEQGTHDQLIHTGGLYTHLHSAPGALLNSHCGAG